jgi:hypothetical protein
MTRARRHSSGVRSKLRDTLAAMARGVEGGGRRRGARAGRPILQTLVGPIVLVVVSMIVAWCAFQVSALDALIYVGYQLAFIVVPGCLAYLALTGTEELGLGEIATGWAVGYALELAGFVATAALGMRHLFFVYPAVVCAICGTTLIVRNRGRVRIRLETPRRNWLWALAGVVVVVIAYFAELSYVQTPAPTLHRVVDYHPDIVWATSLAAEARHHWPLQIPNLAGQPLHYHYFVSLHMAAVNQVTGISLFDVVFRLTLPTLALVAVVQFAAAGRAIFGSAGIGVIAAALYFVVSSADPFPVIPSEILPAYVVSPSFAYGLVFFIPLVVELRRFLCGASRRLWPVIAVLCAAAAGAKSTILPDLIVALGGLGLWLVVRTRRIHARLVIAGVTVVGFLGASLVLLYKSQGGGLERAPLLILKQEEPFAFFLHHDRGSTLLFMLIVAFAVVLGTLKLVAVLLPGLVGAFVMRTSTEFDRAWLIALFAASIALFYTWVHAGQSQAYFYVYGYAAGCLLSAAGLLAIWRRYVRASWPSAKMVAVCAVVVGAIWAVDRPLDASPKAFWRYWDTPAFAVPPCCVNGLKQFAPGMTPDLYRGLRWLADHSDPNAVLVVSNQYRDPQRLDARYFFYSAFAERRVLIESQYTGGVVYFPSYVDAHKGTWNSPLQHRFDLTFAIFDHGDRRALAEAKRDYGVRYLVADRLHGLTRAELRNADSLGRVVFHDRAVDIVYVGLPGHDFLHFPNSPAHCISRCP